MGRTKVDEDGTVMEWDADKGAWFPKVQLFLLSYCIIPDQKSVQFDISQSPDFCRNDKQYQVILLVFRLVTSDLCWTMNKVVFKHNIILSTQNCFRLMQISSHNTKCRMDLMKNQRKQIQSQRPIPHETTFPQEHLQSLILVMHSGTTIGITKLDKRHKLVPPIQTSLKTIRVMNITNTTNITTPNKNKEKPVVS